MHFEGVFGSEVFPTQKPEMIGDSEFDITAGKAAGVRTVGALYGFSREDTFKMYPPDFEINSADQLVGLW
jgi:phosphoglycolate phosphatase-like HAD superfamily hydrolase